MRKLLLLAALAACTTGETPGSDPATTADGTAALTPADIAGTWSGISMAEGSDSVTARWTVVSRNDTMGVFVPEGSTDSIPFTVTLMADSMLAVSAPYAAPGAPAGQQQRFRSVGRLHDGKLVGVSTLVLATNPDSVLGRTRWEATKAPQ